MVWLVLWFFQCCGIVNLVASVAFASLLTLNSSKTEFLLIGLSKQLANINNSSLTATHSTLETSASYLMNTLLFPTCYHIRQLRCIRPYLDTKTASTIATAIVHSKLDYCNSLYHNLPKCQITRLQQIQNSLARAVVKAPESSHITPIIRSLYWLKITERIGIQARLTYVQSSHNHPTFISA